MSGDRYTDILWPDTPFALADHTILAGKRGSEAHGLYVPPSDPEAIDDRDIMGICIPPVDYYFGTKRWEGVDAIKGCWDVVLYSFPKFMHLLTEQNPNVISLLWVRREDYIVTTPEGLSLIEHRELFRSRRRAFKSFVGYANGQLKRMTHFQPYQGYMGAKRKALVDKYGYDTKNASHLIRLLKMGIEYLETGQLRVFRSDDRDELLAIKQGKWSLTDVKLYADKLFKGVNKAYEDSPLDEIDHDAVNALCVRLTDSFLGRMRMI